MHLTRVYLLNTTDDQTGCTRLSGLVYTLTATQTLFTHKARRTIDKLHYNTVRYNAVAQLARPPSSGSTARSVALGPPQPPPPPHTPPGTTVFRTITEPVCPRCVQTAQKNNFSTTKPAPTVKRFIIIPSPAARRIVVRRARARARLQ